MTVYYDRKKYGWFSKIKKRMIFYSEANYGKYAKLLAEKSDMNGLRHHNHIELFENYGIIKIFSKTYGYKDVYFDIDDLEKVILHRWSVKKDKNTFYCRTSLKRSRGHIKDTGMAIHRYLLDYTGNGLVDHIDRNGLNNRKGNLRIVTTSINNKNCKVSVKNNCNFPGVYELDERFVVTWNEGINKRKIKRYSIRKYGRSKALFKAKRKSIKERLKHGYIVDKEFIEQIMIYLKVIKQMKI